MLLCLWCNHEYTPAECYRGPPSSDVPLKSPSPSPSHRPYLSSPISFPSSSTPFAARLRAVSKINQKTPSADSKPTAHLSKPPSCREQGEPSRLACLVFMIVSSVQLPAPVGEHESSHRFLPSVLPCLFWLFSASHSCPFLCPLHYRDELPGVRYQVVPSPSGWSMPPWAIRGKHCSHTTAILSHPPPSDISLSRMAGILISNFTLCVIGPLFPIFLCFASQCSAPEPQLAAFVPKYCLIATAEYVTKTMNIPSRLSSRHPQGRNTVSLLVVWDGCPQSCNPYRSKLRQSHP